MELHIFNKPCLNNPTMIAVWPGMGYLAKTSGDYLRKRLNAILFAEIRCFHNSIIYRDSIVELPYVSHRFYSAPKHDLIICVGDSQPSIPEEGYRLAKLIIKLAERFNVKRIYTLAAYPSEYHDKPQVYGVISNDSLKKTLLDHNIHLIEGEGAVNGLNGVLIGVAKKRGIEGICLMAEIKYANVPQHLSSKAVLEKLTSILGIEIDTSFLEKRARKVEDSILRQLKLNNELDYEDSKSNNKFRYIC